MKLSDIKDSDKRARIRRRFNHLENLARRREDIHTNYERNLALLDSAVESALQQLSEEFGSQVSVEQLRDSVDLEAQEIRGIDVADIATLNVEPRG